jgi:hypothetical protein
MRFHKAHFRWLCPSNGEIVMLLGAAGGRVSYMPEAKWLYSFRLFLILFKIEILFTTGRPVYRLVGCDFCSDS